MTYIAKNHAEIQSYQLFAYQETAAPSTPSLWKKVSSFDASLSQVSIKYIYNTNNIPKKK